MPTARPSPSLFPPFVVQRTLAFGAEEATDPRAAFPEVDLPASMAAAVAARRAEFLAGRLCARRALLECAPEHASAVIGVGANRAPLWPSGIVGSVTHTAGLASVAVARTAHARSLGLDVERFLSDERAEELVAPIADRSELAEIVRATGWSPGAALTGIFSAKETVFKCLHPEVGRYFDFRDAWIDHFDIAGGAFRGHLRSASAAPFPAGYTLAGRFAVDADLLWTAMILPP